MIYWRSGEASAFPAAAARAGGGEGVCDETGTANRIWRWACVQSQGGCGGARSWVGMHVRIGAGVGANGGLFG
jgi:hypothetical protein